MAGIQMQTGLTAASPKKAMSPLMSSVIGIVISVLIGGLLFWFSFWFSHDFLKLNEAISVLPLCIAIITAFGGVEEVYRSGYGHTVPVGYQGVPTFLRGRRRWFVLAEGTHWLPPFIMGFIPVNVQLQTSITKEDNDLVSKDGQLMRGSFFFKYMVTDPYLFLSTEDTEASLIKTGVSAERGAFASENASELATDDDKKKGVARRMTIELAKEAVNFGIGVIELSLERSEPPKEVMDANAQKDVELAQRASESLEQESIGQAIARYEAMGFSPEKAYEIHAAERGKIQTTRNIFKIEGVEPLLNHPVVGELINKLAGAPKPKEKK